MSFGHSGPINESQIAELLEEEEVFDSDSEDGAEEVIFDSNHESESAQSEASMWSSEDEIPLNTISGNDSIQRQRNSYFVGKDKVTKWSKIPPNPSVRTRSYNIISESVGPKGQAREVTTFAESFLNIFSKEVMDMILNYTNMYIKSIEDNFQRNRDCKVLSYEELLAFFGLLFMSGVLRSSHLNFIDLWATDGTGIEFFHTTMSYNRFLFILRCLRFDRNTREERSSLDKLAAVRDLCDLLNASFERNYSVSENVTIDEQLPAFRGKFPGVVYMPSKPNKYGIKHIAVVDSKSYYLHKFEVYAGTQPDGLFKLPNDTVSLVTRMVQNISGSGRNITMDNWFSSIPLAKKLLEDHRLTMVGTLRKNKSEIPPSFQASRQRDVYSSLFGFQPNLTLCSYVSKPMKAVLLLSSMHHDNKIDENDKQKPEIIQYYNQTKGGVDTNDQMCATYNVGRRTKRWPMVIFFHLFNVTGINAYVIYKAMVDQNMTRRVFIKLLAVDLVKPHRAARANIPSLPRPLQKRLREAEEHEDPGPSSISTSSTSKGRCVVCPRSRDRKIRSQCTKCVKFVCKDHLKMICVNCQEKDSS